VSSESCLQVVNVSLPSFATPISGPDANRLAKQLDEWNRSDFAGYRRLLDSGSDCHPDLAEIRAAVEKHSKGGSGKPIKEFVLLGTGGSSLGSETLIRCLRPQSQSPRFHFADNNDPTWFSWLMQGLDPAETLVFVASKSGKTPETISQFLVLLEWIKKAVPGDGWKQHFVLCTDPAKGDLRDLAKKLKLTALSIPSPVGGRFSVLTSVGLFPAAYAGIPLEELLAGAASVAAWEKLPWDGKPLRQARPRACAGKPAAAYHRAHAL
jgi:glucose-6-phosphate isomerase